jgi:Transposase DDE domain
MRTRTESRPKAQLPINGDTLRTAVAWVLDAKIFAHLKLHGNTKWVTLDLILLAVVWVWSDSTTLTGAFTQAHRWSMDVLKQAAVGTFQGLMKALVTWSPTLLALMKKRLQRLMEDTGGKHWRIGGWMPLAVDGSRSSTPRTRKNEKAFCAPNFGKSYSAKHRAKKRRARGIPRRVKKGHPVKPQIWTTLLWSMGLQMPWDWKLGPSHSSEREHFQTMLREEKYPEKTLFCADAGFTGYDLWKQIIDGGHAFLIRVGANVTLLRKLGYCIREYDEIVYMWPTSVAQKQMPPLILRLFGVQVGKCKMWLVSNVLDDKQLSEGLAVRLYRLRWGIELQFRTVKQTFARRMLRSRTPDRALVELDWSLMGLWLIQLFAVKEQIAIGGVPENCSVGSAINIIRTMMETWSEESKLSFAEQMQGAQKDAYQRKSSKKGRYRPDSKDKPAAGKPKIQDATEEQKKKLKELLEALP